jgi:hypothetical protein
MVESGSGGATFSFLVYITASSTSSKLVASGSQEFITAESKGRSRKTIILLQNGIFMVNGTYLFKDKE